MVLYENQENLIQQNENETSKSIIIQDIDEYRYQAVHGRNYVPGLF